MLTVLGKPRRCCDGFSRRELLQAGALSLFGSVLTPALSTIQGASPERSGCRARSVVLLDLFGGPSHLDTFDPKPLAPVEIRGTFKPIATSLPGLHICEHLPRLARWMHRTALIRTVSHGYNSHNPYAVMTGYTGGSDREDYFAKPSNHPGMGAVCAEHAGNAIVDDKDAYNHKVVPRGEPRLPPLPADVTVDSLDRRRTLLKQVDEQA